MALTNYTGLVAAITAWLEHDDVTGRIDDFIDLAEAQHAREIRILAMQKSDTGTLSSGTLAAPTDIVEPISFALNIAKPKVLEYLPPERFFDGKWDTGGEPDWYTLVGNTFHLSKVPDSDSTYDYTLSYYARFAAISSSNATNWLLTNAPDVYLYGTLAQAAPYIHDDARLQTWHGLYRTSVISLQSQDQRMRSRGGRQRARAQGVSIY